MGAQDVNIQDQHSRVIILKFNEIQNTTTLIAPTVKDTYTITVANTTGFIDGRYIILSNPDIKNFGFFTQVGAPVGNVITVDTPIDIVYPIGSVADATITNMNVNGSVTPRVFGLRGAPVPESDVDVTLDITRIIFHCQTDGSVDLTKFGDIAEGITRGLVLRRRDGIITNLFNVKTNGEIAGLMFDISVSAANNPQQGVNGFMARLTFAGQSKMGVTVRLPGGEDLEFLVQDDLESITLLEVIAEGHVVE